MRWRDSLAALRQWTRGIGAGTAAGKPQARRGLVIGGVYEAVLDAGHAAYFQHIANDPEQLGSDVIRVFTARLPPGTATVDALAMSSVDFHVHASIRLGKKLQLWRKIGKADVAAHAGDLWFRTCNEFPAPGGPRLEHSRDWSVWRVGERRRKAGALNARTRQYEIGFVVNPVSIVHRMRTGQYDFVYPTG